MRHDLRDLQDLSICEHLVLIEQQEQKHLVGGDEEHVALAGKVSFQLSIPQVEFPIEHASIIILVVVELSECLYRVVDFLGQAQLHIGILKIVGPVSTRQNLHIEVNIEVSRHVFLPKLLAQFFTHLHVLEHHLQSLCELEPAFLL